MGSCIASGFCEKIGKISTCILFYESHFTDFYFSQNVKVKKKIDFVLDMVRNLEILLNGFQKKSQKTPRNEIKLALRLKRQFFEEKKK